jgi:predicted RNA-binding protein
LQASDIADVVAAIGMQAGTTVYYDVVVVRKNGKKIRVGRSLGDKREAEWLAGTIKRAISD